jgi:hypothetical protein
MHRPSHGPVGVARQSVGRDPPVSRPGSRRWRRSCALASPPSTRPLLYTTRSRRRGQGVPDSSEPMFRVVLPTPMPRVSSMSRDRRLGLQHRLQSAQLTGIELAAGHLRPPGGPACRPSEATARRQPFTDIRGTLNRRAAAPSLAPASIKPAAASRTCSCRARSSAVGPPPSGHLIPPAQNGPHQPSQPGVTHALEDL